MNTAKRSLWGTRFGFYLAAVGSAVGLGNLWRFPYITVQNGGGAFILLYVICAFGIGLPFLIGELILGKVSRRSVISACFRLSKDSDRNQFRWVWIGRLAALCCLMILSYYAVISGWVLHFLVRFFANLFTNQAIDVEGSLNILRENGLLQMALTSVHLLLTLIIVIKGVHEGIEKWVSNIMPIFVFLVIILVTKTMSLPSAADALRFEFYPDFGRLTWFSLLQALGHVFFTLSIGFGTMVTFGSYLNEQTKIPVAGFRVTVIDTFISLFAGLLVFPLLMTRTPSSTGPELLFQTIPKLFLEFDSGFVFGLAFFVCLYLAALGASIGLLESAVANLLDITKLSRAKAAWVVGGLCFLMSAAPALSTSLFRNVHFRGHGLLELLDMVLIDGLVPISALGLAYLAARKVKAVQVESEFLNDDSFATAKLYSHWLLVMKWIAPTVIIFAFILAIIGAIRLI